MKQTTLTKPTQLIQITHAKEIIAVKEIITIPKTKSHLYPSLHKCRKLDITGNPTYYHRESLTIIVLI